MIKNWTLHAIAGLLISLSALVSVYGSAWLCFGIIAGWELGQYRVARKAWNFSLRAYLPHQIMDVIFTAAGYEIGLSILTWIGAI